jgi:hypothetical protein
MPSSQPARRNDGDTAVYGVSALKTFWAKADEVADEMGLSRSAAIVAACEKQWKTKGLGSRGPGRPKKKVVKK